MLSSATYRNMCVKGGSNVELLNRCDVLELQVGNAIIKVKV